MIDMLFKPLLIGETDTTNAFNETAAAAVTASIRAITTVAPPDTDSCKIVTATGIIAN